MKINVCMLGFMKGELRPVTVPDTLATADLDDILNLVYINGQNEVENLPFCSVSVGDVIIHDSFHLIMPIGFQKLTPAQFMAYQGMSKEERRNYIWELQP